MIDRALSFHRLVAACLGLALGGILVALIFWRFPLNGQAVVQSLSQVRPLGLALILVVTAFHCLISAYKWRLVTRWTTPGVDLGAGYYFYTALICLLGQVLPVQLTQVAGRGVVMRLHRNISLRYGAGGAVYDQLFDLAVPGAMLLPVVLLFWGILSTASAGVLAVGMLIAVGLVVAIGAETIARVVRSYRPGDGLSGRFLAMLTGRRAGLLFAISVIRFLNLGLRAWLIGWSLGLDLSYLLILFASCGTTFALLFGFVPGAIGVVEWGWIGMLHVLGVDALIAAQYAIGSRILTLGVLVALNGVHLVGLGLTWYLAGRLTRSRADE